MDFQLNSEDYVSFIKNAYKKINENKDYITELDSATGDGDHWVNINMGFEKLDSMSEELKPLSLKEMFNKIGMTMMSVIGGSSGVLYGGAYIAASKLLDGKEFIDKQTLKDILKAQIESMMKRGNAKPGDKTMIDTLHCALEALEKNIDNDDIKSVVTSFKEGAIYGANSTKDMPASKGRATYQTDKGVGHLDPGAVSMSFQLEELADYILNNKI